MHAHPLTRLLFTLLVLPAVIGCGRKGDRPDLGTVTGVVTLDGKPLAQASVSFSQTGKRPSVGTTDGEGRYTALYIRDIEGVAVGENLVRISKYGKDGATEIVHERYNSKSDVKVQVKPGRNELNWDLTSE